MLKGTLCFLFLNICTVSFSYGKIDSVNTLPNIDIVSHKKELKNLYKNEGFIAQALQNQSAQYYIKNYGLGQVSTISYKGQNAENTTILWENLPINSIMTGVFDLNLLSNQNTIKFSHINNQFGSGGFINIEKNPILYNQFETNFNIYSNHLYSNATSISIIKNNSKLLINNQYIFGDNSFQFINKFNEPRNQINNHISQFNSQLYFKNKFKKSEYTIGTWLNTSQKQVPPTMTSDFSSQELKDINFRAFIGIESSKFEGKVSFHTENQHFTDPTYSINSTNNCFSFINYWNLKQLDFLTTQLDFKQYINYYLIKSNNYSEYKSHLVFINNVNIKKEVIVNHILNIGVKQQTTSTQIGVPLPYFNYIYTINKKFTNTFYIDLNQRMPTSNELYWNPGGNLNILSESIFQIKNSINYFTKQNSSSFSILFEPFYSNISNGIKWLPTSNPAIWSPINIQKTENYGLLIDLEWSKSWNKTIKTRFITSNQWLKSTLNGSKDNIYNPNFKNTNQGSIQIKNLELSINTNYTSYRYTDIENAHFLDAYFLINPQVSYTLFIKKWSIKTTLGANNASNSSYQEIDNRAMPMRYYFINLNFITK